MQLPPDLLAKGQTALAAVASALSLAGIFLALSLYAFLYFSLLQLDATISPQFPSIADVVHDAGDVVRSATPEGNTTSPLLLLPNSTNIVEKLRSTSNDLDAASLRIGEAQSSFRSAMGLLHLAAMAGCLSLLALFSSVLFLSISVLLSYYPKLFSSGKKDAGQSGKEE